MICLIEHLNASGPAHQLSRVILHEGESVIVGRQSDCGFPIDDSCLSRRHFMIDATAEGFRLRDLGSLNGTRLNGVPVTVAPLCMGDAITAGASRFAVTIQAEAPRPTDKLNIPDPLANVAQRSVAQPHLDARSRSTNPHFAATRTSSFSATPGTPPARLSQDEPTEMLPPLGAYFTSRDNAVASPNISDFPRRSHGDANARQPQPVPRVDPASEVSPKGLLYGGNAAVHGQGAMPIGTRPEAAEIRVEWPSALPEGLEEYRPRPVRELVAGHAFLLMGARNKATELCGMLGRHYRIGMVVNRDQLNAAGLHLLNYLAHRGAVTRLSETIYWVEQMGFEELLDQLAQTSIGRDATIRLGIRQSDPPPQEAIAELCHLLCYPSMLLDALTRSQGTDAIRLFRKIVFLAFEKDASEDLYLFTEPGFRTHGTLIG